MKPSRRSVVAVFSTVSLFRFSFRPEVDNDVISGEATDYVGMDVHVKFGDSRSSGFRNIRRADFVSNERTNMKKHIPIAKCLIGVSPNNSH